MPVSRAHMAQNSKSVTFAYGGESVTVAYRPALINDTALAQLDTDLASRNAALVTLLLSWDVYEDDAMSIPTPIDVEHLAEMDIEFKSLLVRAIVGDMRPN